MKEKLFQLLGCLALAGSAVATPQGTAFTYQGRLTDGGAPANGLYEMQFALFDAVTNGIPVGAPVSVGPVAASNGVFSVTLDFGVAAFMGEARWLKISVRTHGSPGAHTALVPRQPLTPAPYALYAVNAASLMGFANAPLDITVNGPRALRWEPQIANANLELQQPGCGRPPSRPDGAGFQGRVRPGRERHRHHHRRCRRRGTGRHPGVASKA